MADDLKVLVLVPIFGVVGAAATLGMWWVFDVAIAARVSPAHTTLACIVFGLLGPAAVAGGIWLITKRGQTIRWPAGFGLGMVFATELAFYLPIGFMAVAFHQPL
jgi:hypothetical protein